MKRIAALIAGAVLVLLGGLWSLQGAGVDPVQSVLCFVNCEEIIGRHPLWLTVGRCTLCVGIFLIAIGARPGLLD